MMSVGRVSVLLLAITIAAPIVGIAQEAPPKQKTLYERLGRYDMIAKIVDTFLPKLGSDPRVASMISGLAATSRNRNRQFIVDQLCEATGGPCVYIGRTMVAAHQGLGITQDLWELSQKKMGETLDELKIKDPERSELIAVIEKLRPDIVQKPAEETKKQE